MIKNKGLLYFILRVTQKIYGIRLFTSEELENIVLTSIHGVPKTGDYATSFNSEYYQYVHGSNPLFNKNNWLMDELDEIIKKGPSIITELGCGNCLFSAKVAEYCSNVYAIDWAEASGARSLPENVTFLKKDIVSDDIPSSDLICSGDFWEHLPAGVLKQTISKVVNRAPLGYHKIACYDDGHSHLSILPPWQWLLYFQEVDPEYKIKKVQFRRNSTDQIVIVISNY